MSSITVACDYLWMAPLSDLTAGRRFSVQQFDRGPAVNVATRLYAAGNYRAVRQPGRQRSTRVSLSNCTDAQVEELEAWQGVALLFREPRGAKFAAVYSDLVATPRQLLDSWQASFTATEVTFSEAV